jgi:hypothetical protein
MRLPASSIVIAALLAAFAVPAAAQVPLVSAEREPASFRIFLNDGSSVQTYGEYARVGTDVVFSMPLGSARPPRLELVTLPAATVDWPQTDRYTSSVKYARYAETRGEVDFAVLSAEITAMLNKIARTTDPTEAIAVADEARRILMAWPAAHYGYRQDDVREIVGLIDDAVAGLNTTSGARGFELSLVAMPPPAPREPLLPPVTPRGQVDRLVSLVAQTPRSIDRIALLRTALSLLDDPATGIAPAEAGVLRGSLDTQLRGELEVDAQYVNLAQRLTTAAATAASEARVVAVQRSLDEMEREDARLGGQRPDMVRALRNDLDLQLDIARALRLRRDQWQLRRRVHRAYVDSVSAQVSRLTRAGASLHQIRQLSGPSPQRLKTLGRSLSGGAERLEKMTVPEQMRPVHDQLIAAWRFGEDAVATRLRSIDSGEIAVAWEASSAAAGSIMMLARAQDELRQVLEYPRLK